MVGMHTTENSHEIPDENPGNLGTLLIVHHSPTDTVRPIVDIVKAACEEAIAEIAGMYPGGPPRIRVIERQALDPDAEELRAADAVIFGTTANFGYISGALKHYFDTLFYQVNEEKVGTPVSWWIRGGYDTTGAEKALRSIITGLKWQISAEPVEFTGAVEPQREKLEDMAQNMVGALLK